MYRAKDYQPRLVDHSSNVQVVDTDKFLMEISRLTGKPIPAELEKERGQLVDALADSQAQAAE